MVTENQLPAGLQPLSTTALPTRAALSIAELVLSGQTTVDETITRIGDHLFHCPRTHSVVTVLTTFVPEDPSGWTLLGGRAWIREWRDPSSPTRVVPEGPAGAESALTMPWMSQFARDRVVVVPDRDALPPGAEQDKRELAAVGSRSLVAATLLSAGQLYGSLAANSADDGPWPDEVIEDVRLLSAALAARMGIEAAKRATAEAIVLADQARGAQQQFFATIGHELRTPVAAILGFAEVMGEDAKAESREKGDFASGVEHDSGVIVRAAEQLHDIIEDLLSTGRTLGEEGSRAEVDLADAVADVIHWHRTPAEAKEVTVVSKVEEGLTAEVRASGLRQVLTNLIGNAIIHNPVGGLVEISAERTMAEARDPRVRVMVRDHGRGLTADELARVFDPFVRFAAEGVKGTGLGLSLARAVAERDGGLVGAESTPGEGSVFWVDLPASAATSGAG